MPRLLPKLSKKKSKQWIRRGFRSVSSISSSSSDERGVAADGSSDEDDSPRSFLFRSNSDGELLVDSEDEAEPYDECAEQEEDEEEEQVHVFRRGLDLSQLRLDVTGESGSDDVGNESSDLVGSLDSSSLGRSSTCSSNMIAEDDCCDDEDLAFDLQLIDRSDLKTLKLLKMSNLKKLNPIPISARMIRRHSMRGSTKSDSGSVKSKDGSVKSKDESVKSEPIYKQMSSSFSSLDRSRHRTRTNHAKLQRRLSLETYNSGVGHIEMLSQKPESRHSKYKFRVFPQYAYPNARLTRDEIRIEMNKPSKRYHDLHQQYIDSIQSAKVANAGKGIVRSVENHIGNNSGPEPIGKLHIEILQCFGLPRSELIKEISAFGLIVCGNYAFRTDTIPSSANPVWLSKMRRACTVPLFHAYARAFVGVFSKVLDSRDGFVGRIVVDVARLRPGSTYDVTLPLREHAHVVARQKRGAVRLRVRVEWTRGEREALLSYWKASAWKRSGPDDTRKVHCCDAKAFQNVARVVHGGSDMAGRFSMRKLQATFREINWNRIHFQRYVVEKQLRDTREWRTPVISAFVFAAWMHCVLDGSLKHLPAHIATFFLIHLWRNYALYAIDPRVNEGFLMPTWEEMLWAVIWGKDSKRRCIEPLSMEHSDASQAKSVAQLLNEGDEDKTDDSKAASLQFIADHFRAGVKLTKNRKFKKKKKCFTGKDGVDFLVNSRHANDREDAVNLGRRLESELNLFRHVQGKRRFEDDSKSFYTLLNASHDQVVIETHKPWGPRLFELIGFTNDPSSTSNDLHMGFPFATGKDHPRFSVKESIVIRSRESKQMMKHMQKSPPVDKIDPDAMLQGEIDGSKVENEGAVDALPFGEEQSEGELSSSGMESHGKDPGVNDDKKEIFPSLSKSLTVDESSFMIPLAPSAESPRKTRSKSKYQRIARKKPPNQDMDSALKGPKKPLPMALAEAHYKLNKRFFHLYHHDYPLWKLEPKKKALQSNPRGSILLNPKAGLAELGMVPAKTLTTTLTTIRTASKIVRTGDVAKPFRKMATNFDTDPNASMRAKQDDCERLLQLGRYSTPNPIFSKIAVVAQPVIEILQTSLKVFRSIFNLFTWQDPILSFWLSIIGPFIVVILHVFPWRLSFGLIGVVYFGPQNWLLRILREQRDGYEPPDLDVMYRKVKPKEKKSKVDPHFFSMFTPDCGNDVISPDQLNHRAEGTIRQVFVPDTPLRSHRFYDWPPEPEYAQVNIADEDDDESESCGLEPVEIGVFPDDHSFSNGTFRTAPCVVSHGNKAPKTAKVNVKVRRLSLSPFHKSSKGHKSAMGKSE